MTGESTSEEKRDRDLKIERGERETDRKIEEKKENLDRETNFKAH